MKKFLAMIISLILTAALLAGCGDGDVYERPGTGTTLGPDVTTKAPEPDSDGSYSADPDGDVNDTTGEGMVEEGIDKVESGVDQGMDELEDGIDNMTDKGANGDGADNADAGDSHGATNGNSH